MNLERYKEITDNIRWTNNMIKGGYSLAAAVGFLENQGFNIFEALQEAMSEVEPD